MNDRVQIESKTDLAGYLAVHYHKCNLAMLFANPSVKVRLLLSYVLIGARQEADTIIQCIYHRSIISQCHLEAEKIFAQYQRGELTDDLAEQMVAIYEKKATLAHDRLMELTDAQN